MFVQHNDPREREVGLLGIGNTYSNDCTFSLQYAPDDRFNSLCARSTTYDGTRCVRDGCRQISVRGTKTVRMITWRNVVVHVRKLLQREIAPQSALQGQLT